MEKTLDEVLSALNSGNIFDVELVFDEYYESNGSFAWCEETADIESFDCVSVPVLSGNRYFRGNGSMEHDWERFVNDIQTGKTMFWDSYDDFILADLADTKSDYHSAISNRHLAGSKTLEETLAEFESWEGTPVDILSLYGDYEYGHNIFEGDFDMDVPVRIYASDEEVIVKANFPWIKSNSAENIYPEKLNLKSVLSILPVRVNSQEVKASFVNGEFKLEFPKEQKHIQQQENYK